MFEIPQTLACQDGPDAELGLRAGVYWWGLEGQCQQKPWNESWNKLVLGRTQHFSLWVLKLHIVTQVRENKIKTRNIMEGTSDYRGPFHPQDSVKRSAAKEYWYKIDLQTECVSLIFNWN